MNPNRHAIYSTLLFVIVCLLSTFTAMADVHVIASDTLQYSNDTLVTINNNAPYQLYKTIPITTNITGTIRIKYDGLTSYWQYVQIRYNGENLSTQSLYDVGWTTQAFDLASHEYNTTYKLELWGYRTVSSTSLRNFRVYYDNITQVYSYSTVGNVTTISSLDALKLNQSKILFSDPYNDASPTSFDPDTINEFYVTLTPKGTRPHPYAINQTGLIGWWHFDDNLNDSSGNNLNGTIYNNSYVGTMTSFDYDANNGWITELYGTALKFDNDSSVQVRTTGTPLMTGKTNFTMGYRVKLLSTLSGDQKTWAKGGRIVNRISNISSTYNQFENYFYDGSGYVGVSSTTHPIVNTWYNVTHRANGTNWTVFINGIEESAASMVGKSVDDVAADNWSISTDSMNAVYDDVFLSDRAWTDAEIASYGAGNAPVHDSDLLIYFDMNEGGSGYLNNWQNESYNNVKFNNGTNILIGGDKVIISPSNYFNLSNQITLESWVNVTDNSELLPILIGRLDGLGNDGYALFLWNDTGYNVGFIVDPNGTAGANRILIRGCTVIPLNQLSYVVATYNGSNATLYVNGVQETCYEVTQNQNTSITPFNSSIPLSFGGSVNDDYYLTGYQDEARMYSRAKGANEIYQDYWSKPTPFSIAASTRTNTWEEPKYPDHYWNSTDENPYHIPVVPSGDNITGMIYDTFFGNYFMTTFPTQRPYGYQNGIKIYDFPNTSQFNITITINTSWVPTTTNYNLGDGIFVNLTTTVPRQINATVDVNTTTNTIKLIERPSTYLMDVLDTNLSLTFNNSGVINITRYTFKNDVLIWNLTSTVPQAINVSGHMMNGAQNFTVKRNGATISSLQTDSDNMFEFDDIISADTVYSYNISLNNSRIMMIGGNNLTGPTEYSPMVRMLDGNVTMFFTRNYVGAPNGDDTIWKAIKNGTGLCNLSCWTEQYEVLNTSETPIGESYQISDPGVFTNDTNITFIYYTAIDNYSADPTKKNGISVATSNNSGMNWTKHGRINITGLPSFFGAELRFAWGKGEPAILYDNGTIRLYFTWVDNDDNNGIYLIKGTDGFNFTYESKVWTLPNPRYPFPYITSSPEIVKVGNNYVLLSATNWHTTGYKVSSDPDDFNNAVTRYFWRSEEDYDSDTYYTITPTILINDSILYFASRNSSYEQPNNAIQLGTVYGANVYLTVLAPPPIAVSTYSPESPVNKTTADTLTLNIGWTEYSTYTNWTLNGTEVRNNTGLKNDVYTNSSLVVGVYNFTVWGVDDQGIASHSWIVNVTVPPAPTIISWSNSNTSNSTNNFTIPEGTWVTFNTTADQNIVTWNWYNNNISQAWNYSNWSHKFFSEGSTRNITVTATNANGTGTHQWNVTVVHNSSYIAPVVPPAYPAINYTYANMAEVYDTMENINWTDDFVISFREGVGAIPSYIYEFNTSSTTNASGTFNISRYTWYETITPTLHYWNTQIQYSGNGTWETLGIINENLTDEGYAYFNYSLMNISLYRYANGTVYLRTLHSTNGNPAHWIHDDYVRITLDTELSYTPPTPQNLTNTTYNFGVNYSWNSGETHIGGGGDCNVCHNNTNSFNITFINNSGTYYSNGSLLKYKNITTIPHGFVDISVQSYNSSNGGTLSENALTDNVTIPNNAISILNISASYSINEGETLYIDANYSDADNDTGTFADNSSEWNVNSSTGIVSWNTSDGDDGVYYYYINVSDGYGSTGTYNFSVTVNDVWYAPLDTYWLNILMRMNINGTVTYPQTQPAITDTNLTSVTKWGWS